MRLLLLYNFPDGAAAYDHITIVEHHSLSRGHGPLGLVKDHLGLTVFTGVNGGGLLLLIVPGPGGDPQGFRQGREGNPVPVIGNEGGGKQGFVGAHGDGVGFHILAAHIHRRTQGKT